MQTLQETIVERIKQARVIAIARGSYTLDGLRAMADALLAGGITALEVTMNTTNALEGIRMLAAEYHSRMTIGAGTVLTPEQVQQVVAAGATFIVAPNTSPDVIRAARSHGVEPLPGALTPTEVMQAYSAGARLIKLFPAALGGPDYLKHLRAPLDMVEFVPTGGISLDNIKAFLQAGAVAVGASGALIPKTFGGSEAERAELTQRARQYIEAAR
jgi:2-dehydro-3-deoxyphosphogluconate aldolase/(4S)-4-hydroxy-2-oxoglutarate aldolase